MPKLYIARPIIALVQGVAATVVFHHDLAVRVVAIHYNLFTSAAVANRSIRLMFRNGDGLLHSIIPYATVPASTNSINTLAIGGVRVANSITVAAVTYAERRDVLPGLVLPPGSSLEFHANLLDAGDVFSEVAVMWETIE